jgi:hypothetical protein
VGGMFYADEVRTLVSAIGQDNGHDLDGLGGWRLGQR